MTTGEAETVEPSQSTHNMLFAPEKGNKKRPEHECHIYRDLKVLFTEEYNDYFQLAEKPAKKASKMANVWINLSFCSNILLLVLKIVAFALSLSMSVLSSMVDSAMDIASGLVLYIALKLASKGIKAGNYQKTIHDAEANSKIKFLYA